MRYVFHSVHVARGVHDIHFRNDNEALEHSNVAVACSSTRASNNSTGGLFYKRNNHSTVPSARKRNLLKEDSMSLKRLIVSCCTVLFEKNNYSGLAVSSFSPPSVLAINNARHSISLSM
jgi:hypothetical protein